MNLRTLAFCLVSAVLGAAAARVTLRHSPQTRRVSPPEPNDRRSAAVDPARADEIAELHQELREARREIADLKHRAAQPAQKQADSAVDELRRKWNEIQTLKDGAAKKDLLNAASRLGPEGHALAREVLEALLVEPEIAARLDAFCVQLGLEVSPDFLAWMLRQQEGPAGRLAAAKACYHIGGLVDTVTLLQVLAQEKDPAVAAQLGLDLRFPGRVNGKTIDRVLESARVHSGNPAALRHLMMSIATGNGGVHVGLLNSLSLDPDPAIADAASLALVAGRPPATGALIEEVPVRGGVEITGLERGDIVTMLDGVEATDSMSWMTTIRKLASEKRLIPIQVHRPTGPVTLQVEAERLWLLSSPTWVKKAE